MSDDSALPVAATRAEVWQSLRRHGYAITDDESIGLQPAFRERFRHLYFNDEVLRHDEGDWPVDRKRARDVVRYYWFDSDLELEEHDRVTITDRAGITGEREHFRVPVLKDAHGEELVRALLNLVPEERRQPDGTLGVNLFRTYTNVVTAPHHDNEQFIILYVLNRVGDGATSYLYEVTADDDTAATPVLVERQLDPGQILIFEDRLFKHGATPLEPPPGEATAVRDALVCTVDYRTTYLEPAPAPANATAVN